jgi:transcriptional regulator with XRE-family HTH domain
MQNVHTPAYRRFLKRLIEARTASGLTQAQAAKTLRWPQSRISRMETGERRVDVIELQALAALYHKSLTDFTT